MCNQIFKVIKSTKVAFAYTIKCNSMVPEEVDESTYSPIFNRWESLRLDMEYKIPEKDKSGKLHYHGIVYCPKGFYRKKMIVKDPKGKDYHLKLEEVYDKKGWEKYIHKDCEYHDLEQIGLSMIPENEQEEDNRIFKKKLFLN